MRSMNMESYWIQNGEKTSYPSVENDKKCDILIIGAGICGLTTAYYLSKAKRQVMIVEADHIAYGASGRSTGKLSSLHGCIYHQLIRIHGEKKAGDYYKVNQEAIESIKAIIDEYQIECDYEESEALAYCTSEEKAKVIMDEIQALKQLAIPFEKVAENTIDGVHLGIKFRNQAQFNPYKYCVALAKICEKQGVQIYEKSSVSAFEQYEVTANQHKINFNQLVMATQVPLINEKHFYYTKMAPYQSYLAVLKPGKRESLMTISIENLTRTSRSLSHQQNDYLISGGFEHKAGQDIERSFKEFERYLNESYPQHEIISKWSSQDLKTFDHLPLIGRIGDEPHLYFATGFNKWGNTLGTVAAKILCSYLLEQESVMQDMFYPHRLSLILNKEFIKENGNVAINWFKNKQNKEEFKIPAQKEAEMIVIDTHPYGIYRDEKDHLHIVDIICPHLGCTLIFNDQEKSWDCPCHGSRFDIDGQIIKGPAICGLHSFNEPLNKLHPCL